MKFLILDSLCYCMELRTASLLFGVLFLVINGIYLGLNSFTLKNLSIWMVEDFSLPPIFILAYSLNWISEIRLLTQFILCGLLIIQIFRKKLSTLRWIYIIYTICYVKSWITYFIFIYVYPIPPMSKTYIVLSIIQFLFKSLTLFFLLLVRSYYINSKLSNENGVVYSSGPEGAILLPVQARMSTGI